MKKSLETKLTDDWKNIFQRADYFEALNFSFRYQDAIQVYKYAHGGKFPEQNVIGNRLSIPTKTEWDNTIKDMCELVPVTKDRERIIVKVFNNYTYKGPLSASGQSGMVFILDGKLLGWSIWMQWIA